LTYSLYSIGHSRLEIELFIELLKRHGVTSIVDVRSFPASRIAPQFNRAELEAALTEAGIAYHFAGAQLGGKGRESYEKIRQSPPFRQRMRELITQARETPTAIMCAEEDPFTCHRRFLITRSLMEDFAFLNVQHIRKDGSLQEEPGFPESAVQMALGF